MANVNDVHDMAYQAKREMYNLHGAYWLGDIHAADFQPAREFINHRRVNEDRALSTIRDNTSNLRRASERAHRPLVEFESVKDTNRLLKTNADEYGISDSSNDKYRKVLRLFLKWLDADADYGDYPWWEDVKVPGRSVDPVDPDELLTTEEVTALREAAEHPREKAMIEFLADTGLRIAAAMQLRRRDINGLDTKHPTFKPNREGEAQKGLKTLPFPIIQSQDWLRVWLNQYHPEDHPEAPVFCVKHYGRRERENAALSPNTARDTLKDLGESIGIERSRLKLHGFRHVATTRMRRDMDMDWDDIAHRTGWSDASLSRMKQTYAHLTHGDKNDRVFNAAGREVETTDEDDGPVFVDCIGCGAEITAANQFCPECGVDQESGVMERDLRRVLGRLGPDAAQRVIDAIERVESDPVATGTGDD